jgi:hypothetical protein
MTPAYPPDADYRPILAALADGTASRGRGTIRLVSVIPKRRHPAQLELDLDEPAEELHEQVGHT